MLSNVFDMSMTYDILKHMEKKSNKIILQPSHVKAFNFIKKYIERNVVAPEVPEIAAGIKATERHTHRLIDDLCSLGHLSKIPYRKRSISIVKDIS